MLKDKKQLQELQEAETSKKIAKEYLDRYYHSLEELTKTTIKKQKPSSQNTPKTI